MYQIAALGVTLLISICGGLLTGFIVSNACPIRDFFDDEEHFDKVFYDIPMEDIPDEKKGKGGEAEEDAE